ncbi:MAG TPA: glycosyltransferase family 2 protein [Vicinamibacterales bacterium]|nr:glycosyltransferase family 2 protein [Vicinamibacterales bacterium]
MTIAAALLGTYGLFLTAYVAYQLLLFAANALIEDPRDFEPARRRRLNVVVPVHNEELYLPRLLSSLQSQEYPPDSYRVTVVADNCTDGTVAACGSFDVDLFERHDTERRGKGHAIRWALERIDVEAFDALAIVDGDSLVPRDFLAQLNLQLERGDRVIQCYNGVANPGQSWFTRLMNVSRTIANEILHPAKRKLGLSSHLMGNGMCFDLSLLKAQGWDAFSVGEDWEYYARLVMSGAWVGYSRGARVYHQESITLRQASSQRIRWSSGRFQVLRRYAVPLVLRGIRSRSLTCLDAALPLVFPNPSLGVNLTVLGLTIAGAYWLGGGRPELAAWFATLVALQLGMFVVGVFHTENRRASAASLVLAPVFLAWKLGIDVLSICGVGLREWKRTERRLS